MTSPTRCLAVDDHPTVRQGLGLMFGGADDLELVGTVESGEEVLDAVERAEPEVVIMDVRLPGIDGISAVKRIAEAAPSVQDRGLLRLRGQAAALGRDRRPAPAAT